MKKQEIKLSDLFPSGQILKRGSNDLTIIQSKKKGKCFITVTFAYSMEKIKIIEEEIKSDKEDR